MSRHGRTFERAQYDLCFDGARGRQFAFAPEEFALAKPAQPMAKLRAPSRNEL